MLRAVVVASVVALTAACHPGPVVDTGAKPPDVGGTIAGVVRTEANAASLAGRKVTAVNEMTGARFDATTASNGGYTIQVPAGTYRLELELHTGETASTRPDPTQVAVGDLDADRNFVVTVSATTNR
jgi:hypothetical protein